MVYFYNILIKALTLLSLSIAFLESCFTLILLVFFIFLKKNSALHLKLFLCKYKVTNNISLKSVLAFK